MKSGMSQGKVGHKVRNLQFCKEQILCENLVSCKTCKFGKKSKFCLKIVCLFALCNWICSLFVVSFLSVLAIEEESMAEEEEFSSRSNCSSTTLLPEWK